MADEQDERDLSIEEQNKIGAYLAAKIPQGAKCTVCGHVGLEVAKNLISLGIASPAPDMPFQLGGKTYPMAMTVCPNCLNVQLHAAVPMGIIRKGSPSDGS